MSEHHPNEHPTAQSLRLIFSYEGEELRLESRQPITMAAPPSQRIESGQNRTGFWTEVRDARGSVLHQRAIHNPVRRFVEVFSPDPEQPISYVPVQQPQGAFAVVVPTLPGADHVTVMGSTTVGANGLTLSVELHRVSLEDELS